MNMAGMMWRQKNDPPLLMALVPEIFWKHLK
jgi:hypothetical protein